MKLQNFRLSFFMENEIEDCNEIAILINRFYNNKFRINSDFNSIEQTNGTCPVFVELEYANLQLIRIGAKQIDFYTYPSINKCPIELFEKMFGQDILNLIEYVKGKHKDIFRVDFNVQCFKEYDNACSEMSQRYFSGKYESSELLSFTKTDYMTAKDTELQHTYFVESITGQELRSHSITAGLCYNRTTLCCKYHENITHKDMINLFNFVMQMMNNKDFINKYIE